MRICELPAAARLGPLVVGVALILAACDGAGPGADGVSSIAVISAPAATLAGAALPEPAIVELRDASGDPVALAGVEITASVTTGQLDGTTSVRTNAEGRAVFTGLVLRGEIATTALRFTCCELTPTTHTISLVQAAGLLTRASPTRISARAGSVISPGPKIRLVDAGLGPVAGTAIEFTISAGGTLPITSVTTDANGEAELPSIELDDLPQPGRVFAAVPGTTQSVWFEILPTVSGSMELVDARQSSATVTGSTVTLPVVRVTDGGPVIGTEVQYRLIAGDGTLSSGSVQTGADGRTVPPTLHVARGENTIEIVAPGYTHSGRLVSVIGATGAVTLSGGVDVFYYMGSNEFDVEFGIPGAGLYIGASDVEGPLPANYPMTVSEVGDAGQLFNWGGFEIVSGTELSLGGYINWAVPMASGTYEIRVTGPMVEVPFVFRATRIGEGE